MLADEKDLKRGTKQNTNMLPKDFKIMERTVSSPYADNLSETDCDSYLIFVLFSRNNAMISLQEISL